MDTTPAVIRSSASRREHIPALAIYLLRRTGFSCPGFASGSNDFLSRCGPDFERAGLSSRFLKSFLSKRPEGLFLSLSRDENSFREERGRSSREVLVSWSPRLNAVRSRSVDECSFTFSLLSTVVSTSRLKGRLLLVFSLSSNSLPRRLSLPRAFFG